MRITGLKSVAVLAAFTLAGLGARPPETPLSVLSALSAFLSNSNAGGAISVFDKQMPDYGTVEQKIGAMATQDDVNSAIDIVTEEEAAGVHKLDLDWLLTLTSRTNENQMEQRRMRVKVEMREIKGKLKITAIDPVSIFDPLQVK